MAETNDTVEAPPQEGEEGTEQEEEVISLPKKEYEKLNQTVGSLKRQVKDLTKPKDEPKESTPQSNEPDYAKLGFLNSVQVNHPDDQKAVIDEANRLKLPLTDVLQMEHIKNKLRVNKETRDAQEGTPSGSNRSGNASAKSVDYWLAKGGLPSDQELAEKVVEARMQSSQGKKFADEMFND